MFLAQLCHESDGFNHVEEINPPAGHYNNGAPGKSYHGRGFIQLSHGYNYRDAGNGIGMGDELYYNPEIVSQNDEIGMKVSVWFWKRYVGTQNFMFGATTKKINGRVENGVNNVGQSKHRYQIYKVFADEIGVS